MIFQYVYYAIFHRIPSTKIYKLPTLRKKNTEYSFGLQYANILFSFSIVRNEADNLLLTDKLARSNIIKILFAMNLYDVPTIE